MRNWSGGYRGRRTLLFIISTGLPAAIAITLGVWHVVILGLFCVGLVALRSRTRRQAALAVMDDEGMPRITVTLEREAILIHSGEHCWTRRHAQLFRAVHETTEAIILCFANSMTAGIPKTVLDSARDWRTALDALLLQGKRHPQATVLSAPPGTVAASVSLPPETRGVSITSKLILLVFTFAGFHLCHPLETVFQFGAGVLGYLAGVLFLMAVLSSIMFPIIAAPCDTVLTDKGVYLHSGAQDAFCAWEACVDIISEHEQLHLIGDWGAPFITIPDNLVTPEFADFAHERIIATHGSLPDHEHEHEHHHEHDH